MFSADQLKDASVLKAECTETVYLENILRRGLRVCILIQAQYATYLHCGQDVNHDGKKDLILQETIHGQGSVATKRIMSPIIKPGE
jgi:hypothetical protein